MFELNIKVDGDEELKDLYEKQTKTLNSSYSYFHSDSGFDVYLPKDVSIKPGESMMIDLKIKCEPKFPGGFYLYPRSSFSKTSLRLKNGVGIVDHNFRGKLAASVENLSQTETFEGKKGERYFQLCHPSLIAMKVNLVDSINTTTRGEGGFGSTGK